MSLAFSRRPRIQALDHRDIEPATLGGTFRYDQFLSRWRQVRVLSGFTQEQLAEAMSLAGLPTNRATIASLESGRRRIRIEHAAAFSAACGVSLDEMVAQQPLQFVAEVS